MDPTSVVPPDHHRDLAASVARDQHLGAAVTRQIRSRALRRAARDLVSSATSPPPQNKRQCVGLAGRIVEDEFAPDGAPDSVAALESSMVRTARESSRAHNVASNLVSFSISR